MIIYTVNSGDTIYKIAREYGVPLDELLRVNGLKRDDIIPVGAAVAVPTKTGAYRVQSGDSLYTISKKSGVDINTLIKLNPRLKPPYNIYPGEYISLPSDYKLGTIEVNGYCYPNITNETLNNVLPYLTYISVFSYNISADGTLSEIPDERIINAALEQNVAPLMTIANLNTDDNFDSDLAYRFLRNDVAQQRFIDRLPTLLKDKGYLGVNLDFEYVYEENREDYNVFMTNLSNRLSAEGLLLTTALAPKTSTTQRGILYEGHDYKRLGEICDWIMLMTYDWGYVAGPPQAVSPINEVERVLKYAIGVIPPDKLLMGIPNYGYDWELPYVPGTTARYLTLNSVLPLAGEKGAVIEYDKKAETPFFTYRGENGREHIVWFDDAASYYEKLRLVSKYGLRGVGIWTINNYYPPFYSVLSSMYDIKKVL